MLKRRDVHARFDASGRKQVAQVVVGDAGHPDEWVEVGSEWPNLLANEVLCQLSYDPIRFISKHLTTMLKFSHQTNGAYYAIKKRARKRILSSITTGPWIVERKKSLKSLRASADNLPGEQDMDEWKVEIAEL